MEKCFDGSVSVMWLSASGAESLLISTELVQAPFSR